MQNISPWSVGCLAAEAHQVFVRDSEIIAQRSEMLFDEIGD